MNLSGHLMIVIWIFVNLGAFIKKPMPTNVFVLQHSLGSCFPLPQTDLANSESSGNTKSGEPVEDCSMYLTFRDRPMEVTRWEALTKQVKTMPFCLNAGSAAISG